MKNYLLISRKHYFQLFDSTRCLGIQYIRKGTYSQGWARDVKARDRDETESLTSRDRDETETLASPAETRPRQDVKISRRDRDVKVKVLLIAITGLDDIVIFHVYCF